ncbi:glutaredoxin family protein [Hydrogenophaga sp. BPS33]|uniref:glutaredoxin family protein n=1 Tax=Hydrogenophaga sp. BPS33 TaxID=2651974 RepID=UPI0013204F36|nr:glutaredoxin family protein [Hydrogenophaga sp. BPS33]QHE86386.1 glutaredoxin family protein [Hydrogenophaga sp. BPS33]
MNATPCALRLSTLAVVASLFALPVLAQGVYRIVGPDGRVTFSDQPPPGGTPQRTSGSPAPGAASSGATSAQLPFELRQTSSRFPVTLYTSSECAPCNSGRNLLNARGIPYTEKTVETPQDSMAFKRVSGDGTLPFLSIGGQQIKGYSDSEWTQFLDAAGYPKQSALPANYRRPVATPLVTVTGPGSTNAPSSSASDSPPPRAETPVTPSQQNPAGIRF